MRTFCKVLNEFVFVVMVAVAVVLPVVGAGMCAALAIDHVHVKHGLYKSDLFGLGVFVVLLHCSVWWGLGLLVFG